MYFPFSGPYTIFGLEWQQSVLVPLDALCWLRSRALVAIISHASTATLSLPSRALTAATSAILFEIETRILLPEPSLLVA
jgi:hypothetical protein